MNPQENNRPSNQTNQDQNPDQINTDPNPNPSSPQTVTLPVQTPAQPSSSTDVLGIISIVLAFVGLAVIGLIVGIIGMKNAKNEGRSTTLSKIGIILNVVVTVIISLIFVFAVIPGYNSAKNTAKNITTNSPGSAESRRVELGNLVLTIPEYLPSYQCINDGFDTVLISASTSPKQVSCTNREEAVPMQYYEFICTTNEELVNNIRNNNSKQVKYNVATFSTNTSSLDGGGIAPPMTVHTLRTIKNSVGCAFVVVDRVNDYSSSIFALGQYPEFDRLVEAALIR